jgi:hypothetical protein
VAFEDVYRIYREVIAASIRVLRPQIEVTTTGLLDNLEGEVAHLHPQVVVCSQDKPASLPPGLAWAKIPLAPVPQTSNVTLETLLGIIDGTEEKIAHTEDPKNRQQLPDQLRRRIRHPDQGVLFFYPLHFSD